MASLSLFLHLLNPYLFTSLPRHPGHSKQGQVGPQVPLGGAYFPHHEVVQRKVRERILRHGRGCTNLPPGPRERVSTSGELRCGRPRSLLRTVAAEPPSAQELITGTGEAGGRREELLYSKLESTVVS